MGESILIQSGRMLGVVQLRVGDRIFAVPVQALDFSSDQTAGKKAGGFFVSGDTMGILVDDRGSDQEMRAQLLEGCAEAVRHLSARYLN